jgi:predicted nuclease with TOPRIM domain
MNSLMVVIFILVLIVLTVFNIYYLYYFKSKHTGNKTINETDNYYKLDAKIELQKYLAIGLISIAGIFGYSKFEDLSNKYEDFESTIQKYNNLEQDYENLRIENDSLKANMERMKELFSKLENDKDEIENEFFKQNQKIKVATQKIPESNIRSISILLSQFYIKNLLEFGYIDQEPYSDEVIQEELVKLYSLLVSSGLSSQESKNFINEKIKNSRIEGKLEVGN